MHNFFFLQTSCYKIHYWMFIYNLKTTERIPLMFTSSFSFCHEESPNQSEIFKINEIIFVILECYRLVCFFKVYFTWTMNVLSPRLGVRPTALMNEASFTKFSTPWKTPRPVAEIRPWIPPWKPRDQLYYNQSKFLSIKCFLSILDAIVCNALKCFI